MKSEDLCQQIQPQSQNNAFRTEFSEALNELLGKIRFRGHWHHEWIAEQIAWGLSDEPMIRQHLIEMLRNYDDTEKESA